MKFICPKCKKIIDRDMRLKSNQSLLTKRGYKTFCETKGGNVFAKPLSTNFTPQVYSKYLHLLAKEK